MNKFLFCFLKFQINSSKYRTTIILEIVNSEIAIQYIRKENFPETENK